MPKKRKKLNPKNFTNKEHNEAYEAAMLSGEIQPGEHLPELKPKKDGKIPVAKS